MVFASSLPQYVDPSRRDGRLIDRHGASRPSHDGRGAAGTSGAVTGIVFRDYNGNGAKDGLEPGLEGIEIRAFDAAGAPSVHW